jgi:hypothetical protein
MKLVQQVQTDEKFLVDDLRFYVWAFDQFVGDVRDLLSKPRNLPRQYTLEQLDSTLAHEFEEDADYQRYWWLYYDRAAEAVPLLESDGPEHYNHPVQGFGSHMDFDTIRDHKEEEAYINLVGSNVDRKLGDLAGYKPTFYAEPLNTDFKEQVDTLNKYVVHIKDNNSFHQHWESLKFEMIGLGSGVMQLGHGVNRDNSELAMFKNYLNRRTALTAEEFRRFEDVFSYHKMKYVPSFNCVRYRGASGAIASSLRHRSHRQFTHFEHISVAEAKNRWPDKADDIYGSIDEKSIEVSPHLSMAEHTISDMVTVFHHRIKFPVRESMQIPIIDPNGGIYYHNEEVERTAIGHITRVSSAGIVDMKLDYYDHSMMDYVQCINYPSIKHSCGIGMVKFGRDPAIVHNQMHNGAIEYFGRQIKGGGYYIDQIISDDDLKEQSKGNRWVKVDISKIRNFVGRNEKIRLSDFIIDNRPPAFPTAWAGLMDLESQAVDRSMKSGSAYRGERTGYSGLQQSVASQDAAMMHVNTHAELKNKVKEMADITFANIVQFDGDRRIEFTSEDEFGELQHFSMNEPRMPVSQYDMETGQYKTVPTFIKNHIGSMRFVTKIEPENIVPSRPMEKTNFFIQMLQFIFPYSQSSEGRIMLRGFQAEGMRIPGLNKSLDLVDEHQKEMMKMQSQLSDLEQEYQRFLDDREFSKDKAEMNQNLLRLTHKFLADLLKSNPNTVQQLLGQNKNVIQQNLIGSIQELLEKNNTGTLGGKPPMLGQQGQQQPNQDVMQNLLNMNQNQ